MVLKIIYLVLVYTFLDHQRVASWDNSIGLAKFKHELDFSHILNYYILSLIKHNHQR